MNIFRFLDAFMDVLSSMSMQWKPPLISKNADDETVCEWWNGNRKLTIYADVDGLWYIKAWGADMDNEMEDGAIEVVNEMVENRVLKDLWSWLMEGKP